MTWFLLLIYIMGKHQILYGKSGLVFSCLNGRVNRQ